MIGPRSTPPRGAFLASVLLILGGCAAAPKAASAPEAPAAPAGGAGQSTAAAPAAAGDVSAAPVETDEKKHLETEDADPASTLARAERELEQSLLADRVAPAPKRQNGPAPAKEEPVGDVCTVACKALASMRRSADRLCELAPSDAPDATRCGDARDRVSRAERRVRERCPSCAAAP